MRKCIFVLSIDTEEEWDWDGPFPNQDVSVDNVQKIPEFHQALTTLGVRPTYFLDYAVLENTQACQCLKSLADQFNNFEFGSHLHPWVTPPKTVIQEEADSHIVNLPIAMVKQQIEALTTTIQTNFNRKPVAFRSGRWGINNEILNTLIDQGYQVDSSVYPYYKNAWFNYKNDTSQSHWVTPDKNNTQRKIYELPVTAGFNVRNYAKANKVHQILESQPLRYLRPIGLLWKLNWLKKIYLSPELSNTKDMIQLCKSALNNELPIIHMYLHSSSLLPGASSYVKSKAAKAELIDKITETVDFLKSEAEVTMCTISEAASLLNSSDEMPQ